MSKIDKWAKESQEPELVQVHRGMHRGFEIKIISYGVGNVEVEALCSCCYALRNCYLPSKEAISSTDWENFVCKDCMSKDIKDTVYICVNGCYIHEHQSGTEKNPVCSWQDASSIANTFKINHFILSNGTFLIMNHSVSPTINLECREGHSAKIFVSEDITHTHIDIKGDIEVQWPKQGNGTLITKDSTFFPI